MELKIKYLDIQEIQDIVFLNVKDAIKERIDPGEKIIIKRSDSSYSSSAVLTKNIINEGFIGVPLEKSKRYNHLENDIVEVFPDANTYKICRRHNKRQYR